MGILGRMTRLAALSVCASVLIASCGGGNSVTVPIISNPSQVQVDQNAASSAIALLNVYRGIGSVAPVSLDTDLCKGCQLHANYLTTNSVSLGSVGLQAHSELPAMPG